MSHVLIADDDESIRTVLVRSLRQEGYEVSATQGVSGLMNWVREGEGDIVLLDVIMPDGNAFDILPDIKRLRPDLPVIILSAQNTLSTAVKATEYGAYEYLPKPFDLKVVAETVNKALGAMMRESGKKPDINEAVEDFIVGRSSAMQNVYRLIARLTQSDLSVLIRGESGTGKELVARALHNYGRRAEGPFVAVNMAAIPAELIESELFGHEKGAFTGAVARKTGRFEQAHGGTLFLDEIGDMPLGVQTRLLRVLQEGEFTAVGSLTSRRTDVRIIAATHRDLTLMIKEGKFREDLYYRLNVVPLPLPALRERKEDIPDLANYFLRSMSKEGLPTRTIDPKAIDYLKRYNWPGNIREMENLLRRLSVIYTDDQISLDAVRAELPLKPGHETAHHELSGGATYPESFSHFMAALLKNEDSLPEPGLYQRLLLQWESVLLDHVLKAVKGNQIRAAHLLGINRNTLRKKMNQALEITSGQFLPEHDSLDEEST